MNGNTAGDIYLSGAKDRRAAFYKLPSSAEHISAPAWQSKSIIPYP